jgi:glycosyltransferase involved in cell wall biosynthesis
MFAHDIEVEGRYQSSRKHCSLFKLLLSNAELLITQNTFQQDTLLKLHKKETVLISNGYPILATSSSIKKEIILWVSRCDNWKNPEIFIELAKRNPNFSFIMICPPAGDKTYFFRIKEKAKKINNLKFLDFVSIHEIDSYFQKAKVFVNTSESEGFPNTFLQAAASGTPIVSLNVDPNNFITENNCGAVCYKNTDFFLSEFSHFFSQSISCANNIFNYALKHLNIKEKVLFLINQIKKG